MLCYVVSFSTFNGQLGSSILHTLQSLEVNHQQACQGTVTIVKPGGNEGVEKGFCHLRSEELMDMSDAMQVEERSFHDGCNVGLEG